MPDALRPDDTNLWLARELFDLGAITFGDFTLGRTTVHSPIYVNPRFLISAPQTLARVGALLNAEIGSAQRRRRPRISPFDVVAGVPYGGLHLATTYSLATNVPMIYGRPGGMGGKDHMVEGRYVAGQTALIMDDLITGGGSVLQTARLLEELGLEVKDAVVLIDREQGATEALRQRGYNLISILNLKQMLTYYRETDLITAEWYQRSMEYLERN